jgi:hypothetical protein
LEFAAYKFSDDNVAFPLAIIAIKTNNTVKWLALLLHTHKVPSSNLGLKTSYLEVLSWFPSVL